MNNVSIMFKINIGDIMNAKEFERQDIINKCSNRNIEVYDDIKSISIREYIKLYCDDLCMDLKLINNSYRINSKIIFKEFLLYCYENKLRSPRLRMNYNTKEIELYNNKKYQTIVVYRIKY